MAKKINFINEFRKYLYTIYQHEGISTQETEMCLNSFAKYLLSLKGINLNQDKFVIHKVKPSYFSANQTAKMEHENGKFDIYLNKDCFKITNIEELEIILSIFISCAHEVQHVIQYIKAPHMMKKYDDKLCDLKLKVAMTKAGKKSRTDRKFIKKLTKLYEDNLAVSSIELNATFRAYQNFLELLYTLKDMEKNKSFANFIDLVIDQVEFLESLDYNSDNLALEEAQKNVDNLVNNHDQNPKTTTIF